MTSDITVLVDDENGPEVVGALRMLECVSRAADVVSHAVDAAVAAA